MAAILGTASARAPRTVRQKSQTVMRSLSSSQLNVSEHQQHSLSPSQVFVGHLEKLVDYLENSGADKAIQGTLIGICHQLKSYGPQLEISHKGTIILAC